jgi:hypothetical protein
MKIKHMFDQCQNEASFVYLGYFPRFINGWDILMFVGF